MKKWFNVINSKLLITFLLIFNCTISFAKGNIAKIKTLNGNVFVMNDGKIQQAYVGMDISDFSEIITEERSSVSLVDYYDHYFHLSNSSHIKLENKNIDLVSGYLWLQSLEHRNGFSVSTANSYTTYSDGEAIISFDSLNMKSQVIAIKGVYKFANINDHFAYSEVSEGSFSFIKQKYKSGVPRKATPIGYKSFLKLKSLFSFVKPLKNQNGTMAINKDRFLHAKRTRRIASLKKENNLFETELKSRKIKPSIYMRQAGKVIVMKEELNSEKENRSKLINNLYKSKLNSLKVLKKKTKFKVSYREKKKSNYKIRIFRSAKSNIVNVKPVLHKKAVSRIPASVSQMNNTKVVHHNDFEQGLVKEYKSQKRHSEEVNSLIDQLKSIKVDNKKHY